jgi:hypothetical protein
MGVTEHARALATTASALLLDSAAGEGGLIAPLAPGQGGPEVEAVLGEIAEWTATALGHSRVPSIWRILAHNVHYLKATWQRRPP